MKNVFSSTTTLPTESTPNRTVDDILRELITKLVGTNDTFPMTVKFETYLDNLETECRADDSDLDGCTVTIKLDFDFGDNE